MPRYTVMVAVGKMAGYLHEAGRVDKPVDQVGSLYPCHLALGCCFLGNGFLGCCFLGNLGDQWVHYSCHCRSLGCTVFVVMGHLGWEVWDDMEDQWSLCEW